MASENETKVDRSSLGACQATARRIPVDGHEFTGLLFRDRLAFHRIAAGPSALKEADANAQPPRG
jgi:hypothetical protein